MLTPGSYLILTGEGVLPSFPPEGVISREDELFDPSIHLLPGEWAYNKTDRLWYFASSTEIQSTDDPMGYRDPVEVPGLPTDFSDWFELVNAGLPTEYLRVKKALAGDFEIQAFTNSGQFPPSLWGGIPVDGVTIGLVNGNLTVIGDIGGVESWNDLTDKPLTFPPSAHTHDDIYFTETEVNTLISGRISTAHVVNAISATNISNWNTAFGWGSHSGLYRPIGYVPSWSEVTSKPNVALYTGAPVDNQIAVFTAQNTIEGTSAITYDPVTSTFQITGNIVATGEISAYAGSVTASFWDTMPLATTTKVGGVLLDGNSGHYLNGEGGWTVVSSGTMVHSSLSSLDYASSGHTGFAPIASPAFTGNVNLSTTSAKLIWNNDAGNFYLGYVDSTHGIVGHSYWGWEFNGDGTNIGLRVNGTNSYVGVGTAVPLGSLHLYNGANLSPVLHIAESGFPQTYGIRLTTDANWGAYSWYGWSSSVQATLPMLTLNRATNSIGIRTAVPVRPLDVSAEANYMTLPASGGTTPNGFMRIGYSDHTWQGGELNFGVLNDGNNGYPTWIQSQCPQNYAVSRPLLLNPIGGNVGIGTIPSCALDVRANTTAFTWGNIARFGYGIDWGGSGGVVGIGSNTWNAVELLGYINSGSNSGSGDFQLRTRLNGVMNTALLVSSGGNVSIGINQVASSKLWVVGHVAIGQNTNGTAVIDAYGGNAYYGCNSASNGISIGSTACVGINYSTPVAGQQVFINSSQGSTDCSALDIVYAGSTSILGEAAFLANRGGFWSTLYLSSGSSTNGYAIYSNTTVGSYFRGTITALNFILQSDRNLKTKITNIPYTYHSDINYRQFEFKSEPGQLRYGVIAQEIKKNHPELVRIDRDGVMSVSYIDLLIKEVAFLKNKVADLERRLG